MALDPALLAAILEDPANDTTRLIAADWLDENGEGERAEFVRVQVELATLCNYDVDEIDLKLAFPKLASKIRELRRREYELLSLNFPLWYRECPLYAGWIEPPPGNAIEQAAIEFRRGFVETLRCSWADWQRHADAIRAATPLNKVRLTTRPTYQAWVHQGWVIYCWPRDEHNPHRCLTRENGQEIDPQYAKSLAERDYPGIDFDIPRIRYPTHMHHLHGSRGTMRINGGEPLDITSWNQESQTPLQ